MRTIIFCSPIFAVLFLVTCSKSDEEFIENSRFANILQFDNLQVGQQSYYQLLTIDNFWQNANFEYIEDTLVVEVVAKLADHVFEIKEYFLNPSERLDTILWDNYEEVTNIWTFKNDSIEITNNDSKYISTILTFSRGQIPVHNISVQKAQIKGWKIDVPYQGSYNEYYIKNFELNGFTYEHLNAVVDNVSMQVDGPGYTWIYNEQSGFVKMATYSPWTGSGIGFDLIR